MSLVFSYESAVIYTTCQRSSLGPGSRLERGTFTQHTFSRQHGRLRSPWPPAAAQTAALDVPCGGNTDRRAATRFPGAARITDIKLASSGNTVRIISMAPGSNTNHRRQHGLWRPALQHRLHPGRRRTLKSSRDVLLLRVWVIMHLGSSSARLLDTALPAARECPQCLQPTGRAGPMLSSGQEGGSDSIISIIGRGARGSCQPEDQPHPTPACFFVPYLSLMPHLHSGRLCSAIFFFFPIL